MAIKLILTDFPFVVFSHEADIDYLLARWINFAGGGFYARAGFFAHQACEKYMKALTVQENGSYAETHKLLELAEQCKDFDPVFSKESTNDTLRQFDIFDQVGRYGASAKFDPMSQKSGPIVTAGSYVWSAADLDRLDEFVYNTRSLLDYSKVSFVDTLPLIQAKDRKNILSGTWKGRPPLRVVLTKKNRYFKP